MDDRAIQVIGVGDNVVDNYLHLRMKFPGGNALNFSVYASMLGSDSAYMGIFGNDDAGRHVQQTLTDLGIDISRCRTANGPNGEALLKIEDGERIFISSNQGGVSKAVPMEFIFDDLEYLQSFSLVHTSAYSNMDAYLPKMHGLNGMLSYDFSDDFESEYALSLCQHIDFGFFSCSEWTKEEAMELLEKAVNQGCAIAVATRGPREVVLYNGQSWYYQAPEAIEPVDTLGAGDAFIAAFLVSYVKGTDSADIPAEKLIGNSLRKGASFAADICQVQGAFGHGLSY